MSYEYNCKRQAILDGSLIDFIFNIVSKSIESFNSHLKNIRDERQTRDEQQTQDGQQTRDEQQTQDGQQTRDEQLKKNCVGIYIYGGKCFENLINKNIIYQLNNKIINIQYNQNEGAKKTTMDGKLVEVDKEKEEKMVEIDKYNYTDDIDGVMLMNPNCEFNNFDSGANQDELMREFKNHISKSINNFNFRYTLIGLLNFYLKLHTLHKNISNLTELYNNESNNHSDNCKDLFFNVLNSKLQIKVKKRISNISGAVVYNTVLYITDNSDSNNPKVIKLPLFENSVIFNVINDEKETDKNKIKLLNYIVPASIYIFDDVTKTDNPYLKDSPNIYISKDLIKKNINADIERIERENKRDKSLQRKAILTFCDGYTDENKDNINENKDGNGYFII